jgi:DNA-binding IclR family transcriptional regulator
MDKTKRARADAGGDQGNPGFSKALEKGLLILRLFSPECPKLNLTDIALQSGLNPTPAHRLVETLIRLGYLERETNSKLIKLGPTAMALSVGIGRSFDLLRIVKPFVDAAFDELNVSIDLCNADVNWLTVIYRREAKDTLVFNLPIHAPDALHTTALGKALLSALPEDALDRALDGYALTRRTPNTITSRQAFLTDLRRARRRGYSVNNEELALGLITLGAPLANKDGGVLGAISFDVAKTHYSVGEAERRFAPALLDLVHRIQPFLPL